MPLLQWNPSFDIHIDIIDQQHKMLVDTINSLYDALIQGHGQDVLEKKLDQLGIYAAMHFAREEHYFDMLGYPMTAPHKKEHLWFESKISGFLAQLEGGGKRLTVEVLQFLSDWLVKHIKGSDKQYSSFLIERGVQ